jgi:hypothetical protein
LVIKSTYVADSFFAPEGQRVVASKAAIAVAELREEAAQARNLASTLTDPASVADLLKYASALEADAAHWGSAPPSASVLRADLAALFSVARGTG